jgi:hypothetical protein
MKEMNKQTTVKKIQYLLRQTSKAGNNKNRNLYQFYMNVTALINGFNDNGMSISCNITKFNEWQNLKSNIGYISACHQLHH